jgi:2-polyprenyl-3-methyl-5-hydroxy-6-metoxy-1,4-benzoquinol methylase
MIGFRSTARFVLDHLPAPPSRVLEVGCGSGELALHLAAADYEVVAIDPEAPGR